MNEERRQKLSYVWDRKTFLYIGAVWADPDQLDLDNWIKPFCSSFDEPPKVGANEAVMRDTENNEWIVKSDFRGYEYWDEEGTKHTVTEVGVEIPADALLEEPVIPFVDEYLALTVRAQRDALLGRFSWRYERYASETRLGIETTDSIVVLDKYAQALRDITNQEGFPAVINWPESP